jgi:hypothetical protein
LLHFRPIMMTTVAAILGARPLAIGFGEGGELRRPLGIAIVGGLIVGQMLTTSISTGSVRGPAGCARVARYALCQDRRLSSANEERNSNESRERPMRRPRRDQAAVPSCAARCPPGPELQRDPPIAFPRLRSLLSSGSFQGTRISAG